MKKKKQIEPIEQTIRGQEEAQDSPVALPERAERASNPKRITVEDKKHFKLTKGEKYK